MSGVRIYLRGDETLKAMFRNAPLKLTAQLQSMAIDVALDARETAASKAGSRSGRLARSITGEVATTDSTVTITLKTEGVPYAYAQEMGATTPPHMIVPRRGTALAFFWNSQASYKQGGAAFFAKVMHPGGIIPAKHYIREGLESVRDQFRQACRNAAEMALNPKA